MKSTFCLGIIFLFSSIATRAEQSNAPAADVNSPEAVIQAVYSVISGPLGAPPDWGINTFQMSFDGTGWWIISISWEGQSPAFPLPADAATLLDRK